MLKNIIFKFAVVAYVLFSAVPSYAAVSYFDRFGSEVRDDKAYRAVSPALNTAAASVVMRSTDQNSKFEDQKKNVENLKEYLKSSAIKEVTGFARMINEQGAESALETVDKFIHQKGYTSKKGTVNGVSYVSYSFKPNSSKDAPDFVYQYSIAPAQNRCQVIAAVPALKIQEAAAANYKAPSGKLSLTDSVSNYLGLTLQEKQEKVKGHNGFRVLRSVPGGIAGKAGIKAGDLIIKIDSFAIMKDHTVERIFAYIDGRKQNKALVKVVLFRNGAKKKVEIRF